MFLDGGVSVCVMPVCLYVSQYALVPWFDFDFGWTDVLLKDVFISKTALIHNTYDIMKATFSLGVNFFQTNFILCLQHDNHTCL